MIASKKLTGYGTSVGNILYVTVWNTCFKTDGEMRFLPGDYDKIADVYLEENNTLIVALYPFTDANLVMASAEKFEAEIRALVEGSNQEILTLRFLDTGISPILGKDFIDYFPSFQVKDEMFIFDIPEESGGFPVVYFMPKETRTSVGLSVLDVMAHASHETYKMASNGTDFGRELMYCLINSKLLGQFTAAIPNIGNVEFPTNGRDAIPSFYNIEKLKEIIAKSGVEKLPAASTTKISDKDIPAVVDDDDDDILIHTALSGGYEDVIVGDILKNGTANLSDIVNYGIPETVGLTMESDFVIEIHIDIPDIAKKMCVYHGVFYVIPLSDKFDPEESFGEDPSYFAIVDEKSFPKNIAGNGKE
jgi:hypothetical protein